jgi:hypothetical protein
MTDITQDLRMVAIDNDSYAQAVAAAKAYRVGDDPSGFAFTGKATLMFQREQDGWTPDAFSSTPLIRHVNPVQGAADADAPQDESFLQAVANQVTYLHIPAECQAMEIDDVWGIDCEFLMFALPHPQEEGATAWLLVPGPEGRVIASKHTVQEYQFAELKNAAKDLGL